MILPKPLSLAEAAKQLGLPKKTLYAEYRRGNLRGGFIGGAIYTDADALREWWVKCQENSSLRGSISESERAGPQYTSSKTPGRSTAPAVALTIARGLRRG